MGSHSTDWCFWTFLVRKPYFTKIVVFFRIFNLIKPRHDCLCIYFCDCRFFIFNAGILYLYFSGFQKVDEEEFGGAWELTKEGFMTSFAGFLVSMQDLTNNYANVFPVTASHSLFTIDP